MRRGPLFAWVCVGALSAWSAHAATEAADPTTLPANVPATLPSTQPSTRPALVQMFHGGPGHWCQVCAAAAARKAKEDPPAGDGLVPLDPANDPANGDLITDLPPR